MQKRKTQDTRILVTRDIALPENAKTSSNLSLI